MRVLSRKIHDRLNQDSPNTPPSVCLVYCQTPEFEVVPFQVFVGPISVGMWGCYQTDRADRSGSGVDSPVPAARFILVKFVFCGNPLLFHEYDVSDYHTIVKRFPVVSQLWSRDG